MSELTELERAVVEAAKAFMFIEWAPGQPEYYALQRAVNALPNSIREDVDRVIAALAALVAWRKVGLAFDRTDFDSWPDWHEQWEASEEALRTTADALLAAEGGTG